MKFLQKIALTTLLVTLWGCSGGSHHHVDTHYGPELYGFYIVDSFGVNSEFDHVTPLELDPEVDGGLFDLYWDVESHDDYRLRVGVNDQPTMHGAEIVGSARCGWGLFCEEDSGFICEYTSFGEVGCGLDLAEADYNLVSIDHLLVTYPEARYVKIQFCDLSGDICEVSSLPVDFY